MASATPGGLGIYYEHPDWYRPLFQELDRRGCRTTRFTPTSIVTIRPNATAPYAVVFNRMSPSAYIRGRGHLTFYTLQLPRAPRTPRRARHQRLAARGGRRSRRRYQLSLLDAAGAPVSRSRVIHHAVAGARGGRGAAVPGRRQAEHRRQRRRHRALRHRGGARAGGARGPSTLASTAPRWSRNTSPRRTAASSASRCWAAGILYAHPRLHHRRQLQSLPRRRLPGRWTASSWRGRRAPVDAPKNNLRVEAYTPPARDHRCGRARSPPRPASSSAASNT